MRKIILLSAGMFALGLDAYVIAGLLSNMSLTFHASLSEVGQAISIFTLFYAIAAPLFATLLAGKSTRNILIIALSIFCFANLITAIANSLSMLLFSRALAGIGAGLYAPVAAAGAAALVPSHQRGRALGMILGGMSMGVVFGVPIGLFIAHYTVWQATLWLIVVLGFVGLMGIFYGFPNIRTNSPPTFSQRIAMLTDSRVAIIIGITFLNSIASLGLYTYIAAILHQISTAANMVLYFWCWGIGGVIGSFSIGSLIDRTKSPLHLMLGILAILAIAMLILPLGLHFSFMGYFLLALWGAAGWASQAPQQHSLLALHPNNGATVVALNSSANYLGASVGAALGGLFIWAGLPLNKLPFAASGIAILAFIGQFSLLMRWHSKIISLQT